MKALKLPYSILIYDIETSLLLAFLFQLGEQRVSHDQLLDSMDMFGIITISYKWYGQKEIHTLEGENALEEFDKIARTANVIIGKNNFRFDDKRLNTERLLKGLQPYMEFFHKSDDLESQLRRYFSFPSFSLDALSKHFGLGGKVKMEFKDWKSIAKLKLLQEFTKQFVKYGTRINSLAMQAIQEAYCKSLFKTSVHEVVEVGEKALKKMAFYNKKDVQDTEDLLTRALPYIKLKYNAATAAQKNNTSERMLCTLCGSKRIAMSEKSFTGGTRYQLFHCYEHNGYAGKRAYQWDQRGKHQRYTGKMIK